MKILVHHHKYGDAYYDATDELWAFGQLFKELDEFEAYTVGFDGPKEISAYAKAKEGDLNAAKWLCQRRKDAEYEGYEIVEVKTKPA